jgi:FAD/FMN-containing dehydrogenase
VPDLDLARSELIAALGADAVLSDPLALRLYARDASMVEGSAGIVALVRSTEDVAACMRVAAGGGGGGGGVGGGGGGGGGGDE